MEQLVQLCAGFAGLHFHSLPCVSLTFNKYLNEVVIIWSVGRIFVTGLFLLRNYAWEFHDNLSFSIQ